MKAEKAERETMSRLKRIESETVRQLIIASDENDYEKMEDLESVLEELIGFEERVLCNDSFEHYVWKYQLDVTDKTCECCGCYSNDLTEDSSGRMICGDCMELLDDCIPF